MPRTIVPEEQTRADDLTDLKNNIRPTLNRKVLVESDADGEGNIFWWDSNGDVNNADGIKRIASNISGFSGLWIRLNFPFSAANTDDLAEGSTNLFYTDERVDDRVNNLLVGGPNVSLSYDDNADSLTIDVSATQSSISEDGVEVLDSPTDINYTEGFDVLDDGDDTATVQLDLGEKTTDDLPEGSTNLYFTEDRVRNTPLVINGNSVVSDLNSLLPTAPALDSYNSTDGVQANLSFDGSNTIAGVEPDPNTNRNSTFNVGSNDGSGEQGVLGPSFGTVSGTLNPDVTSSDNYDANVFGQANTGTLKLIVNGSTVNTADLSSTTSAIDTVDGNSTGFDLSQATNITFANGDTFDAEYQRSGTWQVGSNDLRSGWNNIKVRHEDDSGALISETDVIDYVVDDDTATITFSNETLGSLNTSGSRFLSGIEYFQSASATFSTNIDNVYKNTYSTGNAITFNTSNASVSSQQIPVLSGSEDETKTINLSVTASDNQDRYIGDSFEVQAQVSDPIDSGSPFFSSNVSEFDLLIDSASDVDGDLRNQFTGETYRIPSDQNFEADLGTGLWDSTKTIEDGGESGYNDGVQVINDEIRYPTQDFTAFADGPTGNRDYSTNTSGERFFYGLFTDPVSTSDFRLEIDGSATLVGFGSASASTNEVEFGIKLPGETAWLDITDDFEQGQINADGKGAFFDANGSGGSSNLTIGSSSNIGIATGTAATADSFDKLYYRIRVPENWTGSISDINIDWNVS